MLSVLPEKGPDQPENDQVFNSQQAYGKERQPEINRDDDKEQEKRDRHICADRQQMIQCGKEIIAVNGNCA